MASRSHPANEARAAASWSDSVSLPVPLVLPLNATGTVGGELQPQPANNKANGMKPNGMGMKTVGHSQVWKTDAHAGGTEQTCNTGHGPKGGNEANHTTTRNGQGQARWPGSPRDVLRARPRTETLSVLSCSWTGARCRV